MLRDGRYATLCFYRAVHLDESPSAGKAGAIYRRAADEESEITRCSLPNLGSAARRLSPPDGDRRAKHRRSWCCLVILELLLNDCRCPHRVAAPLHLCRARPGHPHRRPARRAANAGRHLSGHQNPGGRRDLAVYRLAAGRDGRPHGDAVRARADHDGQRHRAYRGQFVQHAQHHQGILPAERGYSHRQQPDHGDLADLAEANAGRRHAAADPQLQCLDGADHPARAFGARPVRAGARRPRPQRDPHAARHRAGRGDSAARTAASSGRCRSISIRRPCRRAACPDRTWPMRSPRRT